MRENGTRVESDRYTILPIYSSSCLPEHGHERKTHSQGEFPHGFPLKEETDSRNSQNSDQNGNVSVDRENKELCARRVLVLVFMSAQSTKFTKMATSTIVQEEGRNHPMFA